MSAGPSTTGRVLWVGGGLAIAALFGVAAGYWISDRGIRWLPTVLGAISGVGLVALAAMAAGSLLLGGERRLRRRTIALFGLAVIAGVFRLLVHLASDPVPLSTLGQKELALVASADQAQMRLLERGLDGAVRRMTAIHRDIDRGQVLPPDAEAAAIDAWVAFTEAAFALDQIRRYYEDYYRLDLSRLERDRHLLAFLLTFDSELVLFQRTTEMMAALEGRPNTEKLLDLARPERGLAAGSYTKAKDELSGLSDLSRVVAGRRYLEYLGAMHDAAGEAALFGFGGLFREVEGRLTELSKTAPFQKAAQISIEAELQPLARGAKVWAFPVQANVAEWMGDTRVRRHGRYLIDKALVQQLAKKLEPGDVILARKNWYLSNLGLPGFWPHAALHIGTTADLARAFDQDPEVQAFVRSETSRDLSFTTYLAEKHPVAWAEKARSEATDAPLIVIEAISEGVSQSALDHVTGDYAAALRPKLSPLLKAKAILRAFGYLGRPYDFDFDFATDDAVVCTEMVWRSYRPSGADPGLIVPTVTVAGRQTMPANELARLYQRERGQAGAQLELVAFIEGQEAGQSAAFVDEGAFLATVDRSKWDVGQP